MENPKLIVILYGKFQPPHIAHMDSYNELINKFGQENVFIGTSDLMDDKDRRLSFEWKKKLLMQLDIPDSQIIKTNRPYKPGEVIKALGVDPENSVFVVAFGEKDRKRIADGNYYSEYKDEVPLYPMTKRGYFYVTKGKVQDGEEDINSTSIRRALRGGNIEGKLNPSDYNFIERTTNMTRQQIDNVRPLFESLMIQEGGLGGHISHPYEDLSLSFIDMSEMIANSMTGTLNESREKTDGQNLFGTVIKGQLRLARNKLHLENSLSIQEIEELYVDSPARISFVEGAKAINDVFTKFSQQELLQIFENGKNWINFEVMYPEVKNVIDYGRKMVVVHELLDVDDVDSQVKKPVKYKKMLFDKLEEIKSNVMSPFYTKIKIDENYVQKSKFYIHKLYEFAYSMGMEDDATLKEWINEFWNRKLSYMELKYNHKLNEDCRYRLISRLTFDVKSYKLTEIRKDVGFEPLYQEIYRLDRGSNIIIKEAIKPLETLFLKLGVDVLENMETFITVDQTKTINTIRSDVSKKILEITESNNESDINKMRSLLLKIESIGGLEKISPTEGIVFEWNNKQYKLTGMFAPVNQLLGINRYKRRY